MQFLQAFFDLPFCLLKRSYLSSILLNVSTAHVHKRLQTASIQVKINNLTQLIHAVHARLRESICELLLLLELSLVVVEGLVLHFLWLYFDEAAHVLLQMLLNLLLLCRKFRVDVLNQHVYVLDLGLDVFNLLFLCIEAPVG